MRLLTILALLAVVAGVAGCDSGASDVPDDPATGATNGPTVVQSREQVRSTTEDVLAMFVADDGPLGSAKPRATFANGTWSGCDDDLVTWAYEGSGRIDLGAADTAVTLLPDVRSALESLGWAYDRDPVAADPATSVTARKGPHLLRVRAYTDQPFVLVSVSGPCIEPTDQQRDDLESNRQSEPIDIP
jgi:hypothetical protein